MKEADRRKGKEEGGTEPDRLYFGEADHREYRVNLAIVSLWPEFISALSPMPAAPPSRIM